MKKCLLILMLGILFNKVYPQTAARNVSPAAGSNAGSLPGKNADHAAAHYFQPDEGCIWCVLNVKSRLANGSPKLYKAKCEINFLPGFETVAGDDFDAFIDPHAVLCDTLRCTNPDMITGAPALVKNERQSYYGMPIASNGGKTSLYSKNYLRQYYLRQTPGNGKYFYDIAADPR
jgi:hypothetical protein